MTIKNHEHVFRPVSPRRLWDHPKQHIVAKITGLCEDPDCTALEVAPFDPLLMMRGNAVIDREQLARFTINLDEGQLAKNQQMIWPKFGQR